MFCDQALDAVEAIAAGETTPDVRLTEHYASCPNCAAALKSARELEHLLLARSTPQPPPQFTTRTMARVRRARWRSEQVLDAGFNVLVIIVVASVVIGIWMALHRTGMTAVSNDAFGIMGRGMSTLTHRIAPSLPLYAGASALLLTALGIWWWAERDAAT